MNGNPEYVTARIKQKDGDRLRELAKKQDRTLSYIVRRMIEKCLKAEGR